jgi:hypothetical protein
LQAFLFGIIDFMADAMLEDASDAQHCQDRLACYE